MCGAKTAGAKGWQSSSPQRWPKYRVVPPRSDLAKTYSPTRTSKEPALHPSYLTLTLSTPSPFTHECTPAATGSTRTRATRLSGTATRTKTYGRAACVQRAGGQKRPGAQSKSAGKCNEAPWLSSSLTTVQLLVVVLVTGSRGFCTSPWSGRRGRPSR